MSTSGIEKKKTPRVIRIVLTVFAVLAAVLVIGTAFTVHYIMTDPQIAAAADSTKHLGDRIAYYVDQGKLHAYVDDPGTDSFAFDEERCTEVPEEARSDFGGFTFTAPSGKKFTKIEMKALASSGWETSNLGTGWAYNALTVTWKGTAAASTVDLLKDADEFYGTPVKSIVFYLSE